MAINHVGLDSMGKVVVVSWCFTPSQPVRLYQGEHGEGVLLCSFTRHNDRNNKMAHSAARLNAGVILVVTP